MSPINYSRSLDDIKIPSELGDNLQHEYRSNKGVIYHYYTNLESISLNKFMLRTLKENGWKLKYGFGRVQGYNPRNCFYGKKGSTSLIYAILDNRKNDNLDFYIIVGDEDLETLFKGIEKSASPVFTTDFLLASGIETLKIKQVASSQQQEKYSHIDTSPQAKSKQKKQIYTRKLALVVGNGRYQEHPLENTKSDAKLMASSLSSLGFEVMELYDSNKKRLETGVNTFFHKLKSSDVGLVYYAGHGMQVSGENYLIPLNANVVTSTDVLYEAVPAGKIVAKMGNAGSKVNIVIFDACRNNPFRSFFRSPIEGLAKMSAPTGTVLIYSTSPGSVAADGAGGNGVFVKHFVRHLKQPGLDINDILIATRKDVMKETEGAQVPWESSSLTDNFYFVQ